MSEDFEPNESPFKQSTFLVAIIPAIVAVAILGICLAVSGVSKSDVPATQERPAGTSFKKLLDGAGVPKLTRGDISPKALARKLQPGMSMEQVRSILGEPKSKTVSKSSVSTLDTWRYDDLMLSFFDGVLHTIQH